MEEFEKLYTVEDVAKMTSFTSRTIRNYLKDGTLQGRKAGGQWRFTMENIKQFFDNSNVMNDMAREKKRRILDFVNGTAEDLKGDVQVCTIIDCACANQEAGRRLYEKLVTAINQKTDDAPAKFDYEYLKKAGKARFTLFGNPDYIVRTLQLL